jgi:hypothetical protein
MCLLVFEDVDLLSCWSLSFAEARWNILVPLHASGGQRCQLPTLLTALHHILASLDVHIQQVSAHKLSS